MTPDEFLDAVRSDNETALSRLGSSKSLYAATGGEMDAGEVLGAAADAEHQAAETLAGWADDEPDDDARAVFEAAAAEERDHYDRVVAELDGHEPAGEPSAMQAALRGMDDTVARAGGFVGRALATGRSKEQFTGFFVGQADPSTAGVFRELRGDVDDQLDRGAELVGSVCGTDEQVARAREAAAEAIQAAYGEYTETLEGLGVNPKPVC